MKKALIIAILLSVRGVFAQYCETVYTAGHSGACVLSIIDYTQAVECNKLESVPRYKPESSLCTYTDDKDLQTIESDGADDVQLRFTNGIMNHQFFTESINQDIITRNPYAEVNNGNFGSLVQVIKTVEEYGDIVRNMTCPLVIQYDASWCNPGRRSLSYFFEKAAIKYSSEAKFFLINDSAEPFPTLKVYNGSTYLGCRSYGVSGLHGNDWDNLRKKWGIKVFPSYIIIYNTNGDFLSISSGFNKDELNQKEEELAGVLLKAKSLFRSSR